MKKSVIYGILAVTVVIALISFGYYFSLNNRISVKEFYDLPQFPVGFNDNNEFTIGDTYYLKDKVVKSEAFEFPEIILPETWNGEITINYQNASYYTGVLFESSDSYLYFKGNQSSKFISGEVVQFEITIEEYDIGFYGSEKPSRALPATLFFDLNFNSYVASIIDHEYSPFDYSVQKNSIHTEISITNVPDRFPFPVNWGDVAVKYFNYNGPELIDDFPTIQIFENGSLIGELEGSPNSQLNVLIKQNQKLVINTTADCEFQLHLFDRYESFDFSIGFIHTA